MASGLIFHFLLLLQFFQIVQTQGQVFQPSDLSDNLGNPPLKLITDADSIKPENIQQGTLDNLPVQNDLIQNAKDQISTLNQPESSQNVLAQEDALSGRLPTDGNQRNVLVSNVPVQNDKTSDLPVQQQLTEPINDTQKQVEAQSNVLQPSLSAQSSAVADASVEKEQIQQNIPGVNIASQDSEEMQKFEPGQSGVGSVVASPNTDTNEWMVRNRDQDIRNRFSDIEKVDLKLDDGMIEASGDNEITQSSEQATNNGFTQQMIGSIGTTINQSENFTETSSLNVTETSNSSFTTNDGATSQVDDSVVTKVGTNEAPTSEAEEDEETEQIDSNTSDLGDFEMKEETDSEKSVNGFVHQFTSEAEDNVPRVIVATSISESDGDGYESSSTHFITIFIVVVIICIVGYVAFHNRNKLLAVIIEGRKSDKQRRGSDYRKIPMSNDDLSEIKSSTPLTNQLY